MRLFKLCSFLTFAAMLLANPGSARADSIPVAVLGSPYGGDSWNADVQTKLLATGFFSTVDVFDISRITPTLDDLLNYASVLVYTDGPGFANRTLFGDVLADYVDAGGGVVLGTFSNASNQNTLLIGGRFNDDNYWAILPASQNMGSHLTLGTIYDQNSPLLAGVNSFDGGSNSFYVPGDLHPEATRIADWSNGVPLVVTRTIGTAQRVDLNFYPPSNAVRSDFWLQDTDGDLLMANALVFTGGGCQ
jgi:hypothetical protein